MFFRFASVCVSVSTDLRELLAFSLHQSFSPFQLSLLRRPRDRAFDHFVELAFHFLFEV